MLSTMYISSPRWPRHADRDPMQAPLRKPFLYSNTVATCSLMDYAWDKATIDIRSL